MKICTWGFEVCSNHSDANVNIGVTLMHLVEAGGEELYIGWSCKQIVT